jgi:D-glycero-alpha-D-manno-heptose-7-phosphate kinase
MIPLTFPESQSVSSRRPSSVKQIVFRAKSPMRVSFAGGGTDLPQWYEQHGGAVLSCTINRYAYVTLYPREDRDVNIRSVDMGYFVNYGLDQAPIYDGVLDLAKAAIHRLHAAHGMDLDVRSDAPAGSGLGGSSALTAAVLGAVAAYTGQPFDPYELAELNYLVERHDLHIAGGKQDQYATTFGGFNLIEFHADRCVVNSLRVSSDIINDLEAHLLLCFTGKVRPNLGLVAKQVRTWEAGQQAPLDGLRGLYELAYKLKDVLLKGRLDDFGELLHESYVNKKRMNPEIASGTMADDLYEEALASGAVGGKLLGAGGGGYLLLYCATDRQHEVRQALEAMGGQFASFSFVQEGLQSWRSQSR